MPALIAQPPRARKTEALAERVIGWHKHAGRHGLPWQGSRDPYRVWLSEIMLQQTQVGTVLSYYERFLSRFPDVASLSAASLDEVLALWSGLGYYSRARNLHRCAQAVVLEHRGLFPSTSAELQTLPGIGRSTSAAIAAFCFGERAAILDGNVKRVLCRALGFDADLAMAGNERQLWARAEALLPTNDIAAYTQGLMDLGATVCTLRRPRCADCPLAADCVGQASGAPERWPVKSRRLQRGHRVTPVLWLRQGDRHWLIKRPLTGVWAGLWSWPEVPGGDALEQLTSGWPGRGAQLPELRHALTHFEWVLQPLQWQLPARLRITQRQAIEATLGQGAWFSTEQALALGLPTPMRRWLTAANRP